MVIEFIHADPDKKAQTAPSPLRNLTNKEIFELVKMETGIRSGVLVRRKTGKKNVGRVEKLCIKRTMRDKEWGHRTCDPYVTAVIHWENAIRWLGGKTDWHSEVRLSSLVVVDE